MSSIAIPDWLIWYSAFGVLTAMVASVTADLFGSIRPPRGAVRAALAGVAGVLWPLVAVGLLQLVVLRALAERGRPGPVPVRPSATGVGVAGPR